MRWTLGIASALLTLGLLLLEVYAASARAGDAPHGCAVETQEGLAALRAFKVFLNHVHSLVLSDTPAHCSAIAFAIP